MADTTKVHIALQSARELEIEVEDAEAAQQAIEEALAGDGTVAWITDARGHRFGFVVDKLAFVEFEGDEDRRSIGFGVVDSG